MFDVVGAPIFGNWLIAHQTHRFVLREDRTVEVFYQVGDVALAQHGRGPDGIEQFLSADV